MKTPEFTKDELTFIRHQMQMEMDDWQDYHTPETYRLIVRIVDKIAHEMDREKEGV